MDESIEEIKNKDLSPTIITKATKPQKTWFILRVGDNKIFAMQEQEAWNTLNNNSHWTRRDFKIVGVSDGTTYLRVVKEAKNESKTVLSEIEEIEKEAGKYRKTEEKFVFEDLLALDDPKVIKVRGIINEYDKKLEVLNKKYLDMTRDVAKTAFDAELEVAKGNKIEYPRNPNIYTPGASEHERNRILRQMGY